MEFPLVGFVIATVLLVWFWTQKKKSHGLKELPGPKGLPLIGNIHQFSKCPNIEFTKWSKEFGSIYKVRMPGQDMVVISDPKLTKEMFSNDNAYAGKPLFDGFDIYEEHNRLGIFQSEGEVWEVHRRFLLRQLRDFGFGKSAMESLIMDEVAEVTESFKKTEGQPVGDIQNSLRLAVVNSLWRILTSQRFKHDDPVLIKLATNTTQAIGEALEGGGILVIFPWLRHIIPKWSGFQHMRDLLEETKVVFETVVREHKESFQEDTLRDYLDVYIAEMKKTTDPNSPFYGEMAERFLVAELLDLFIAGSETSALTLTWIILALCKEPHIQKKLQDEITEVTGNSRKVSVADRPNMPYAQAVIDEVLRYSSIAPDGVQHRVLADRDFHGYHIPKDSWVQPNLYFIHHDPKIWGDPESIRPERFLSKDGKKFQRSENLQAFQVGKRQCVGETLARDTVFLYMTNFFQQFSMVCNPAESEPTYELSGGFFRTPKPFTVILKDRLTK